MSIVVDLVRLRDKRKLAVDENLRRINSKRSYKYQPGQKILKKNRNGQNWAKDGTGPSLLKKINVNGSVTVKLTEGVTERLNIRRISLTSQLKIAENEGEECHALNPGPMPNSLPYYLFSVTLRNWCVSTYTYPNDGSATVQIS